MPSIKTIELGSVVDFPIRESITVSGMVVAIEARDGIANVVSLHKVYWPGEESSHALACLEVASSGKSESFCPEALKKARGLVLESRAQENKACDAGAGSGDLSVSEILKTYEYSTDPSLMLEFRLLNKSTFSFSYVFLYSWELKHEGELLLDFGKSTVHLFGQNLSALAALVSSHKLSWVEEQDPESLLNFKKSATAVAKVNVEGKAC